MARMTLEQIWLGATRLAQHRRNYSQSPKRQINQVIPFVGTKTVLFTGSFWGVTEKSVHLSNILVMNCEIIEEQQVITNPIQTTPTPQPTSIEGNPQNIVSPIKPYGGVVNAEPAYSSATHFKATYNGKNYWIKKIDLRSQPVLVRCSCSDYFFTFSFYNYNNGIQFGGRARPYVRKTPRGSGRPDRNPVKTVGVCKHIANMGQILQSSGFAI